MGKSKQSKQEKLLQKIYYDVKNSAAYGGERALQKASGVPPRATQKWLEAQPAYTLHKDLKRNFPRRPVVVGGIDQQWQIDLIESSRFSQSNGNVKFILTVIDVFSKFAWVRCLQNKTGISVTQAFRDITEKGRRPKVVQSDKGKEFLNAGFQKFLSQQGIGFFTTENEDIKASVVERFNRTLQNKIHRYFTRHHTHRYVHVIQDIVSAYNRSVHSATGHAPADVTPRNSEDVWWRLYQPTPHDWAPRRARLAVDDHVRLSTARGKFQKGYLPKWSTEIFKIAKIQDTTPETYVLADSKGEIIKGSFYYQELQRVKPPDYYDIEYIIKRRRVRGKSQYLVKWVGHPSSFNSWVSEAAIKKLN